MTPLKVEGPAGNIRLGLLLQPQFQAAGLPVATGTNLNLFLRRTRLLVGGTLFKTFDYFFDTDYPNLFLSGAGEPTAAMVAAVPKATPGMNVQDAFITYKPVGDLFKVDAGYMLPPLAHNALQGAGTLYSWDYFANSFLSTSSFGTTSSPVGRDLGVQARGLLVDGHIEYRVGMFQGLRNAPVAATATAAPEVGGRDFFRVAARVQINFLDPEPGYFYGGTYLGAKHILSIGGSYDFQDKYKYWAVDGIADLPLGPGVATAQVNFANWDGGTFIPTLFKSSAIMGEVGYRFDPLFISPIFRFERHQFASATSGPTETRYVPGIAFWPFGHNWNLKAFYSRIELSPLPAGEHAYNQFNLQWQVYFY